MKLLATTLAIVATVSGFGGAADSAVDFDAALNLFMGMVGESVKAQPTDERRRLQFGLAKATGSVVATTANVASSAVATTADVATNAAMSATGYALNSCYVGAYQGWLVYKNKNGKYHKVPACLLVCVSACLLVCFYFLICIIEIPKTHTCSRSSSH